MTTPYVQGGYILLARKILKKFWDRPSTHLKVWVYLLVMAAHKRKRIGDVWIERGETPPLTLGAIAAGASYKAGFRTVKPDKSQVSRILKEFAKDKMITSRGTTHGFIITITNYDTYQSPESNRHNAESQPRTATQIIEAREGRAREKVGKEKLLVEYIDRYWEVDKAEDIPSKTNLCAKIGDLVRAGDLPSNSWKTLWEIIKHRNSLDLQT